MKYIQLYLLMFVGLWMTSSCSNDDELPFNGSDNSITLFTLTTANGTNYSGEIVGNKIVVTVPLNVSLAGAVANYSLCELASISPDPANVTDWDTEQTFTVTSYNQTAKKYLYQVVRTDVLSQSNVLLATQADVEQLAASGVTIIDGDLIIGEAQYEGNDSIKDLSPLSSLTEVKQNIIVNNSFAGTSLSGLNNVRSAAGLYLGTSSTVLACKDSVKVELPVLNNLGQLVVNSSKVKTLHLPALQEAGWFYLNAPGLCSIDFSALQACITNFTASTGSQNKLLKEMKFPLLKLVGGTFTLKNYAAVLEASFPALENIDGNMTITDMAALQSLDFPQLKEISGAVKCTYCYSLASIDMSRLERINGEFNINLDFWGPTVAFTSLKLQALESVEGDFMYQGNSLNEMETLELPALKRVAGKLHIYHFHGTTFSVPQLTDCETFWSFYFPNLEVLDISAMTSLKHLTIGGFTSLKEVKSISVLSDVILNAGSAEMPEFTFTDLKEVTGTFELNNFTHANNATYSINGIKKIGTIPSTGGNNGFRKLIYPDLEEAGSIAFSLYRLNYLEMPKLKTISGDFKFTSLQDLKLLELPALEKIGGSFTLSANSWMPTEFNQLSLPVLTEVGSVSISTLKDFKDFSAFKNVVDKLESSQWNVSGCAYNPTLDEMKAGKYTSEEN